MFRKSLRTSSHHRSGLRAMYVGLSLTVVATAAPYVDHATGEVLADHVRHGYPTYSAGRVDEAVTAWLAILTVVGALGLVCWVVMIRAARAGSAWVRPAATVSFALGSTLALTALLTKDTSGEVGLAPLLGWLGVLPCLAGLVAVVLLWRGPSSSATA